MGFFKDFKAFISRGNVLDMAVGVVIGNAFGAIVTALVNILLSVCLWGVPGGLKGLVTVLPAANGIQKGMNPGIGLGQKFAAADLQKMGEALAAVNYPNLNPETDVAAWTTAVEGAKGAILGKYTLHGSTYTYNMSAVIDWGAFINAVISFLIIALVLFIIVRVASKAAQKRAEFKEKLAAEKAAKNGAEAGIEEAAEAKAE